MSLEAARINQTLFIVESNLVKEINKQQDKTEEVRSELVTTLRPLFRNLRDNLVESNGKLDLLSDILVELRAMNNKLDQLLTTFAVEEDTTP